MHEELKKLEADLWEAADQLRANSKLNASEYSMPVLGLIFLQHATQRFKVVAKAIRKTLPSRGGEPRALEPKDFTTRAAIFLPDEAQYDALINLPEGEDLGAAINKAMTLIEQQVPDLLTGVLPKGYDRFEKVLLAKLVRIFNREPLRNPTRDDLFGRIYEYFLNKFAMSGAQEGGEFFTPPSLVRTIVNFIEPTRGMVLDPACGSGGMFVQAAHAVSDAGGSPTEALTFHGQEKAETNTRLSRMNLAVHGLEGLIRQGNTFYDRWPELVGACDYVMANPPFNVDMVDPAQVKSDPRLFTKKTIPGISKKTGTVSNANYLWIQYFHSYLNDTGRAGFVMAQSATDAGHGEKTIREEIIATRDVDIIVSIGTNFFYTRSLPCSLWFFDRGRPEARKDQVLMLDARNVYRVISRKIRDFSDEQLANLTAITWLYRGETDRFLGLIEGYFAAVFGGVKALKDALAPLDAPVAALRAQLDAFLATDLPDDEATTTFRALCTEQAEATSEFAAARAALLKDLKAWMTRKRPPTALAGQTSTHAGLAPFIERLSALRKRLAEVFKLTNRATDQARKALGAGRSADWDNKAVKAQSEALTKARDDAAQAIRAVVYPFAQITWLQTRFPDARMVDVPGLCKVVSLADIEAQDGSLTPGRYVGVAPPEPEDEEAVEARLAEIHAELAGLNAEAAALAEVIAGNFSELLG